MIRSTVEKKTLQIISMFQEDLNAVKKEFENRKTPPIHRLTPKYSGAAYWARALLRRVQRQMDFMESFWHIVCTKEFKEVKSGFDTLCVTLEDYIRKQCAHTRTHAHARTRTHARTHTHAA